MAYKLTPAEEQTMSSIISELMTSTWVSELCNYTRERLVSFQERRLADYPNRKEFREIIHNHFNGVYPKNHLMPEDHDAAEFRDTLVGIFFDVLQIPFFPVAHVIMEAHKRGYEHTLFTEDSAAPHMDVLAALPLYEVADPYDYDSEHPHHSVGAGGKDEPEPWDDSAYANFMRKAKRVDWVRSLTAPIATLRSVNREAMLVGGKTEMAGHRKLPTITQLYIYSNNLLEEVVRDIFHYGDCVATDMVGAYIPRRIELILGTVDESYQTPL